MALLTAPWHQQLTLQDPATQPLLVVHAGTHKTASSYLQNRLESNSLILAAQGVHMAWPGRAGRKHKGLVKAMLKGKSNPWNRYLAAAMPGAQQCLVSAEQFTPAISEPEHLAFLDAVASSQGRRLRLVLFLRDQPDLFNSMYAHTVRRLYHHQDFCRYVRRGLRKENWFANYHHWLAAASTHPSVELLLLPYHSHLAEAGSAADPFNRLATALGWQVPRQGWQPASRREINTQVGRNGIWLARELSKALIARGIKPRSLPNTGGLIREIATREGWTHDRFQGFTAEAYWGVRNTLAASNDQLAERAWGARWAEVFPASPQAEAATPTTKNPQEAQRMEACLEEALNRLLNRSR